MCSGGRTLDSDPNEMILLPPLTGVIELTGYRSETFVPDLAVPSSLLGGRLAIEFANIPTYSCAHAKDLSWEELIVFFQAAGIVSAERGSSLLALSGSDPDAAQTLLSRSVRLRDALRMAFGAMVKKDAIAREWTEPINEILRITEGHDELVSDGISWKLEFVAREGGLDWLLAAIARSAAEILVERAQARLRICANAGCGLFFSDNSRTHRRRLCSVPVCGNRDNVATCPDRH